MRKSNQSFAFIVLFSLASTIITQAQPVLTNTYFPNAGESFILVTADTVGVEAGNAGQNQSWDFSGLMPAAGSTNDTTVFVAAAGTPFSMDFPDANLAGSEFGGEFYAYYQKETNAFSLLGVASDSFLLQYSDPDIFLQTPLNYSGSFSDTYEAVIMDTAGTFSLTGNKTVTYDGYGTLKLPSGTFNNAIRLKTVSESRDSAGFGGGYLLNISNDTEYSWFAGSGTATLLTITYSEGSTTVVFPPFPPVVTPIPPTKTVSYQLAGTSNLNDPGWTEPFRVETLAPNPAADLLRIRFFADTRVPDLELLIINTSGKVLLRQNTNLHEGEQALSIPVSQLAQGQYYLLVRSGHALQVLPWTKV